MCTSGPREPVGSDGMRERNLDGCEDNNAWKFKIKK
jgi:hypothetical protein